MDSDELVRWALERELSAHRMSVRAFPNCAAARDHLDDDAYDLALVEIASPEDNRLRLIEEIRTHHPSATVMAMGCDATPERRRRAFGLGCAQFVDKPFDLAEILNLMRSAVGQFPHRRRFPRYHCRLPLRLSVVSRVPEEVGFDLDNLAGTTVEVARDGLRIRTGYPLRPAQRVRVRLPESSDCVALSPPEGAMTVVWIADDPEGVVAGLRLAAPPNGS